MDNKTPVSIFWFRRDLRLDDNAGLYHALKGENPVLTLFIFDKEILDQLDDKDDARVTFIYNAIEDINKQLHQSGSSLLVLHDKAEDAWKSLLKEYTIAEVYTNHDYEPYAKKRDEAIEKLLKKQNIPFKTYKDQVIFEKDEVLKDDGKPYTVYTPYNRKWYAALKPFYLKAYPNKKYFKNFYANKDLSVPSLKNLGFEKSNMDFPAINFKSLIEDYAEKRNFPAVKGTTHIGLHLRFGTVSIRELARTAYGFKEKTWLNELIWREFYMMIPSSFSAYCRQFFQTGI